jgi:aromatic ring-opening dioxygenase catalytic subunit (LigB family)
LGGTQSSVADRIVVAQAKTAGPREAAEEISRQLASLDLAMIIVFVPHFTIPQSSSKN